MTLRGALTLSGGFASVYALGIFYCGKSGWLTNRTRTQAGCLFYEAVEIGHLLVQGTERHVFTLQSFRSQSLVVLKMLAESIYTELRNLGHSVSRD